MQIEHTSPECTCQGKRCEECKQVKCLGAFRSTKHGVRAKCKWCSNIPQRANGAKYRQDNIEHIKAYQSAYYGANAQMRIAYVQEWNIEHFEHRQAYLKEYYQDNKEQLRIEQSEYYIERQEQIKEKVASYKKSYPQKAREHNRVRTARKRATGVSITCAQWEELKAQYEYFCLCCKKQEPYIKLTLDHIVPVVSGGDSSIGNIQPLCLSCNLHKGTKTIDYRVSFERVKHHA